MWRIFILLSLSVASQSKGIDRFLGVWTTVVNYPRIATIPYCVPFELDKKDQDPQCICDDGKESTHLGFNYVIDPYRVETFAGAVADNPNEVMALLNVSCKCGNKEYRTRTVFRYMTDNYIVVYHLDPAAKYTKVNPNSAFLMAKEIPTAVQLMKDMKEFEELKHRDGSPICSQEVVEMYQKKNN